MGRCSSVRMIASMYEFCGRIESSHLLPRLGVADDALDQGKAPPQPVFQRIDRVMHGADRKRRIDPAMKIDDLAVAGLAHAHVVHFAETGNLGGERRERL